jgi:L-asparaginase II
VLVEVTRGQHVESRHRGWLAVVTPDDQLVASLGDPDRFIYLRSSAKPFQLAPFVASGLFDSYGLGDEALAIMASSHSGEDRHVRTIQAILRDAGLSAAALQCGTHAPYDVETARRLARDGEEPTPLRHNCSGKHTGMLLYAKALGAPIETYFAPDHPVQRAALATISTVTGMAESQIATATDNCGVVTFGLSLRALALAYARLADPSSVADERLSAALVRIRHAMMGHPALVAGERRRLDTALMRAEPNRLVSKGGAEGVQSVAILDGGRGFAMKIEDGDSAQRARNVATCAALHQLGVISDSSLERLAEFAAPTIRDPRGEWAGDVRPAFRMPA